MSNVGDLVAEQLWDKYRIPKYPYSIEPTKPLVHPHRKFLCKIHNIISGLDVGTVFYISDYADKSYHTCRFCFREANISQIVEEMLQPAKPCS